MNGRLFRVVAALALLGCAPAWTQLEVRAEPPVSISEDELLVFRQSIFGFYDRLIQRRFNTLETFNDPVLRDSFQSIDLFFDYYADFAEALADADFEKSRPNTSTILDFEIDAVDRARVLVRFVGDDGRPMRFGAVILDRVDRWERADGVWWVTPERL
ncbi:MAG: hypothetical protein HRU01_12655 [Myxococcales bacterium]|nr:hypothetical protein [Myxococcales bacterium]